MHYKDGTEAKVGDLVIGKGYNVKNEKGEPAVFVGTVIGLVPGALSCNIRVAHAIAFEVTAGHPDYRVYAPRAGLKINNEPECNPWAVEAGIEFGQTDQFELLCRPGIGGVEIVKDARLALPPAPPPLAV